VKNVKKKNFEKKPPKVTKMLGRRMNTGLRIVTYVWLYLTIEVT
jgi:hypothetical protein